MLNTGGSYNYSNGNLNYLGGDNLGAGLVSDIFKEGYYTFAVGGEALNSMSGGNIDPGYGHPLLNVTRTKLADGKLVPLEYGFKPSVAYLLSLLSGVNYDDIVATKVIFKDYGVGALTTGDGSDSLTIYQKVAGDMLNLL